MSASFTARFSTIARNHILRLDQDTKRRILTRVEELCRDPFDARLSKPLHGAQGLRGSRVGRWRIVFEVDNESRSVDVQLVQPRGQVYKRM